MIELNIFCLDPSLFLWLVFLQYLCYWAYVCCPFVVATVKLNNNGIFHYKTYNININEYMYMSRKAYSGKWSVWFSLGA